MKQCPRCLMNNLKEILNTNALSRRDNKTYICSQCGTEEALIDAGLVKDDFQLGVDKVFTQKVRV